jgi:Ni/Fe-hydrogenase subunit HybB-like protein
MVEKRRMPAALRMALLAVLLGILLSAVSDWVSITVKSDFAAQHPAQDWRNDLSMDVFLVTVVLGVSWLIGTGAAVFTAALAANGMRAGQIALTVVLAVFLAYNCQAAYGSANVWEQVSSGTSDPDFVDRNGFLPYLGGTRVGTDLVLFVLALLPLILLWTPATRRFFRGAAGPNSRPR